MTRLAFVALVLVVATLGAEEKKTKPAYIGVQLRLATDEKSVLVMAVINDSPAEKAGLQGGDVLVEIGGLKPTDLKTAVEIIRALEPGKKVTFRVLRDRKEKEIEVTPGSLG